LKLRMQTSALAGIGSVIGSALLMSSCNGGQRARLDSYRALATRQAPANQSNSTLAGHNDENRFSSSGKLSAASLILSREDLLPCQSLPPRKLTLADGEISWVDGSWANFARPFIIKGSAQSGLCRLEIHPLGQVSLNPGSKDAFVRDSQIRILLATPNGDALVSQSNDGKVRCQPREASFEISFDGVLLGRSQISYVMNESIPLDLTPRVCMARILDGNRRAKNEWVFILPTLDLRAQLNAPSARENQ